MAHYALVDENNLVVNVITGIENEPAPESFETWEDFYTSMFDGLKAIQTSYNTRGGIHYDPETNEPSADQSKAFRANYAGIGHTFDPSKGEHGSFIPPKPFDSWILDEETCYWNAPVPMPEDGKTYTWNEETLAWEEINF